MVGGQDDFEAGKPEEAQGASGRHGVYELEVLEGHGVYELSSGKRAFPESPGLLQNPPMEATKHPCWGTSQRTSFFHNSQCALFINY